MAYNKEMAVRKQYSNPIINRIINIIGTEHGALKQLAAKADINYGQLRNNICYETTPSLDMLINISRACEVSLDELCKDYQIKRKFKG